jgi:thiamine biosynthesis lipoprotein
MSAAIAVAEAERINDKYSRYRSNSVLSELNRVAGEGKPILLDEETVELLEYAFSCYRKSGRLFDITAGVLRRAWDFASGRPPANEEIKALLPLIGMDKLIWRSPYLSFTIHGMELDLGGICKEYAVDRVAAILTDAGIEHGLINFGGDLFALGPQPNGQPWQIGIQDPTDPGKSAVDIPLSHGALATSGDYERYIDINGTRYGHILNPHTGWPVVGLSSVTTLAPQCMVAGSLTTIAMLKGRAGVPWLADMGLPHFWVDQNGRRGGILPPIQ